MNKKGKAYEPPKTKVYRFDDNDRILTESGGGVNPPLNPTPDYAANALNDWMGGINTTMEK